MPNPELPVLKFSFKNINQQREMCFFEIGGDGGEFISA
jgi:hypothetical protein